MTAVETSTVRIAVIGNPNTGKSTLFSALTGIPTSTGNYPGVTVEKKIGAMQTDGRRIELIDLPGTYSLAPRSLDEMISVDVLLGRQPEIGQVDAVLCIVDAANLERNLYVVSQVLEIGCPVVLALNMWDVAAQRGIVLDHAALQERLGFPVVPTNARSQWNLAALKTALAHAAERRGVPHAPLPETVREAVARVGHQLETWGAAAVPSFLMQRAILDPGGSAEQRLQELTAGHADASAVTSLLAQTRHELNEAGAKIPGVEARARYAWARSLLEGVITVPAQRTTASDRIDRWLTHRVTGLLFFVLMMLAVFLSISVLAAPLQELCEWAFGWLHDVVGSVMPRGALRSLVTDGVIGGVGGVLVFVPQIALLFLFLSILEDCGYMARAAFVMDKLMTKAGLSGKSFVPLMSSFACAIPGIMATRTIENRRDRLITILIAPLMSCSARAPVYALMTTAFVPADALGGAAQGLTWFSMTFLGAVIAVPIAWLLRRFLLPGETPPFVMELPSYKFPAWHIVLLSTWSRVWAFISRAGTLILAASIVIWGLTYFPGNHARQQQLQAAVAPWNAALAAAQERGDEAAAAAAEEQAGPLEEELNAENSRLIEQSYLGRAGKVLEPAFTPLGWDWKIGVAVLASFPAREVVIATLGTIYSLGGDVDEDNPTLQPALKEVKWPDGRPVYNLPVALSIMVFFALCAQCVSTLIIIRRETSSWGWAAFTFAYMTALAYVGAWLTYHGARAIFG